MCEALIGGAGTSMQAVDGVTGRRSSLRRPAGTGFTWTQTWCGCTVSAWLAVLLLPSSDLPALSVPGFSGRISAGDCCVGAVVELDTNRCAGSTAHCGLCSVLPGGSRGIGGERE